LSRAAAAALAVGLASCVHRPAPRDEAAPAGPHVEPDLVGVVHVVRRGETVYRIARAYGLDPRELMEVNGLADPRQLEVGAELFIPGAASEVDVPPLGAAPPPPSRKETAGGRERDPSSAARADPEDRDRTALDVPPAAARPRPPRLAQAREPALRWPVQGVLYSRYGLRQGQRHDGIDIAAPEGTPVGAAADGTVAYAGQQSGYGEIVIVRHASELVTVYAHASAVLVRPGESVAAGQPIARVGRSGRTTGPHLHFEVREGTRPADPLLFLRR
jgi:murein DD-endopeptidase MepM/ murein hydrolase activator NlpD